MKVISWIVIGLIALIIGIGTVKNRKEKRGAPKEVCSWLTPQTTIGELLRRDKRVQPILQSFGLHCVGCASAGMESIEQAAMVHDLDGEALMSALREFYGEKE
ncbi:MAG: DUF1858 domain-containing protein [Oscillospiraceae bacterium]|nr:DUF1858 domain-containing protein [Oscillospiraceae bacterium]